MSDFPEYNVADIDNTVVATYDGRNIEELIGFVEEEYPCLYSGVNGTLYAGTDGLVFIGKFFLFDKKIFLKWVDVKVQQTDQGVAVQTRDDTPVLHEFLGIHKPERVWSTLVSLHNQALLDRTRSPAGEMGASISGGLDAGGGAPGGMRARAATAQPIHRRKQLRRMTSDPSKLAPAIEALFAEVGKEAIVMDDRSTDEVIDVPAPKPSRRLSFLPGQGDLKAAAVEATKATSTELGVVEISPMSEIEMIVGKVQGEFSCLYNGQTGTMYAGSTALYFAGVRLFFPARLTLKSSHIRQVQMVKGKQKSDVEEDEVNVIKEQGIVIYTQEGVSHTFLGMESPDQVWASLVALRKHVSAGPNSPRPFAMRRMNSDPNLQSKTGGDILMEDGVKGKGATEGGVAEKELAPPVLTDEELQQAWSDVMAKKNRYTSSFVKDHEFACTLDRFFKQYIADDAEFNIGEYMEKQGDKDLKISSWKASEQDGKLVRTRIVKYIHPVNAPMAPPEAAARKEQTYQRFGDLGFIVETKTFVVGVPMADCFFVKDRLIVATAPTKGKVLLSMEMELEFVKSTMFRGIITRTSTSEVSKFCLHMRDYMAESLGEEVVQPKEEEQVEKKAREVVVEQPEFSFLSGFLPSTLTTTSITHGLLSVVILMQFWILLEMHSMKLAIKTQRS